MGRLAILNEKQWLIWSYDRDGRKLLYNRFGDQVGATWDRSYMNYEEAEEASQQIGTNGVAFCFTAADGYCGIDLDDCILEFLVDQEGRPVSKVVKDWAIPILERFRGSWIEFSPSLTGLKIWCRASKRDQRSQAIVHDENGDRVGSIEVYDRNRSFAFTNLVFTPFCGTDVPVMDDELDWLYDRYFGSPGNGSQVGNVQFRERIVISDGGSLRLRERAIAYLAAIPIPGNGERNNSIFRATGHVAAIAGKDGERLSDSEIVQLMLDWNDRLPEPLPIKEVMSVVRSNLASPTPREIKPPGSMDPGTAIVGVTLPDWALADPAEISIQSLELVPVETAEIPEPTEVPREFWEIPGFIGDFVREHEATCFWHQPALALAAAIALQSVLCGRKIRDQFGARPNIYLLGVSGSSTGKEHARTLSMKILDAVGEWLRLGDLTKPKSSAGIGARLLQHPTRLGLIDEFGMFLGRHTKQTHGWKSDVDEALLELYSASGSKWSRGNYGDASTNWEIDRPCLSIYGTTTPSTLWRSMSLELIENGLLGRMLIAFGRAKPDAQAKLIEERPPADCLVDHARAWISRGGDLAGTPFVPEEIVPFAPNAAGRLKEIRNSLIERMSKCSDTFERPTLSRALGSIQKLALIRAASDSHSCPEISLEAVEWASGLVECLTLDIIAIARHRIVESPFQAAQNEILDFLREGLGTATRTEIKRRFRKWKPKEFDEILNALEQNGFVRMTTEKTPGRPVCRVSLI